MQLAPLQPLGVVLSPDDRTAVVLTSDQASALTVVT